MSRVVPEPLIQWQSGSTALTKMYQLKSQCFASVSRCAGAQTWPIRRQLRRAAQSCRSPCPQEGAPRQRQGNRHHRLPVFDGLYLQSVGKAEYRHAKAIGFGSLSHRAGGAVASSVTMRPSESLRFVTETHHHLSPVREAGCASQPQRRGTAIADSHQMKACASQGGGQSAVALGVGLSSLAHRAGSAIACGSAWSPCSWQLWYSPAAAKLHNAALPSVSTSQSQAPFVAATASRPSGEGNRLYAKLPSLESVAQPSALPGRWHALRAAVCAPLWLSWHRGIGQALRAVCLVSGLRPVVWCVPPPTLVLRRCAASALRAGLPVRPPWGLPQPARVRFCLCYKFDSCSRSEYEGHRPTRPVSQRDRWLTFGSYVCDSCEVCQNKIVSSIAAGFGKSSYIRPYIEHPRKKPAIF